VRSLRRRVAEILEVSRPNDRMGRFADVFLIVLIIVNVVAIILESVTWFEAKYREQLHVLEVFSVLVFTIEYLARVWSCVDLSQGSWKNPVKSRLRYMATPAALIDLIAILPFYLAFFISVDLRFLRVVRLLRIFKLTRYSAAMQVLLDVIKDEANTIFAAFFILFILLVLSSSGIYLIEHDIQPEAFGSIPAAMWWSMATLTTVGYGDVAPITPWGKFFGGCITVIGMGMVALPAGILASGFSDHLHRRREHYRSKIDEVLEDGFITQDEESELETLRKNLSLDPVAAEQLFRIYAREAARLVRDCPHCGKSIGWRNKIDSG